MKYEEGKTGPCPHCGVFVRFEKIWTNNLPLNEETGNLRALSCNHCHETILAMDAGVQVTIAFPLKEWRQTMPETLLWPLNYSRPVPETVPSHIATDYNQAALIVSLSPMASAALSRRCLQAVLREAGGFSQHNLVHQIEAAVTTLPSYIATNVNAIRNIGNFAAHPSKDTATGEIVEVEVGEAEWTLDVLDELFDFYYVQPALAQAKRDALNAKLAAAGRPEMR